MLGLSLRSSTSSALSNSGVASPSPSGSSFVNKGKRLAAKPLKPLKLAASAIGSVPSRIGGNHRNISGDVGSTSSATATPDEELVITLNGSGSHLNTPLPTGSTMNTLNTPGTANTTSFLEPPEKKRSKGSKIPGRRKHQKTRGGVGILDAAQVAQVAQGPRKQLDNEEPAALLRVRVVSAEGLVVKDRNGSSDP
jgi:phosphatidylserine decarboxylase